MTQLKLEVGKKYNYRNGQYARITNKRDCDTHPFVDDIGCSFTINGYFYNKDEPSEYDLISEHIEEPMNETKEEIKLEVGKKYIFTTFLANENCEPVTFEKAHGDTYWFRDIDNKPFSLLEKHLSLFKITEHREMVKYDLKGWFNYYKDENEDMGFNISKPYETSEVSRKKAISTDAIQIYGRLTFQQLEEPKE